MHARAHRRTLLGHCLGVAAMAVGLSGCDRPAQTEYSPQLSMPGTQNFRIFRVGVHPLHNPQRLTELYGPLIEHISATLPEAELQLEASRNYEEFEKKLYAGQFDFALPNPYQTVLSLRHGYRIFAKMADDDDFRGLILVRRDSGIQQVRDLQGKSVAYPAATALAATLLPQHYLHSHGLDVNRDIHNLYVGSQESAILNVQRGHTAAAATWPVPWRSFEMTHPDLAAQIEVKWRTATLPNNAWVVHDKVPPRVAIRFADELLALHLNPVGNALLQRLPVSAFAPATHETYAPVARFLADFNRLVRPIPH